MGKEDQTYSGMYGPSLSNPQNRTAVECSCRKLQAVYLTDYNRQRERQQLPDHPIHHHTRLEVSLRSFRFQEQIPLQILNNSQELLSYLPVSTFLCNYVVLQVILYPYGRHL